jgi:hydrogenase maturation factor HypE
MNKYLYSLLLLTALTSQLKGANENYLPRGINYQRLDEYNQLMNNGRFREALVSIESDFLNYSLDFIIEIMADDKISPLMNAVRANQVRIVERIVDQDKFNQIPQEQQTEFLRKALAEANELNRKEIKERLERFIAIDEEGQAD